jgi:outer membrane lipoprotein-sorting protein
MKKLFLVLSMVAVVAAANAQTVDEIVKKNYLAQGYDKLQKATSIYVEGKTVQMGTELPMVMQMKDNGKIKVTISFNGMDIVTAYDGQKGWMINPMTGSDTPVEIPAEQLEEIKKNDMYHSQLQTLLENGKLQLTGDEDVNGKPAYKLEGTQANGGKIYFFIDKESFLLVKTSITVNAMGQEMTVDNYVKETADVNGYIYAKLTATFVNGQESGSVTLDKFELNKEIDDSIFMMK